MHSRRATGQWLASRSLRREFFLCTQICHEGWDSSPAAVSEDVANDLDLLATDYLDLVYLDDNPRAPFEPVVEAMRCEMASGRVRAFGVRNWTAERIQAAHAYGSPRIAAVVTTELALAMSTRPLWPEYTPFDSKLEHVVRTLGLAVFAHAADFNLGQRLFEGQDPPARWHRTLRWYSASGSLRRRAGSRPVR